MLSLIETRNRHFMNACSEIIKNTHSPLKLREVALQAAMSPAPHYYCTFEYALRMLRVLRHNRLKLRNDRRLALWKELLGKVEGLMERRGYKLTDALSHVLCSCSASQFFISPSTAYRLAYEVGCSELHCRKLS
ncbi:MAG: hypothetical protein NC221_03550 [Duncaniella sp.]|nr:hypothetical protein [Muribaculum sp.]MCM1255177.1 hypothetical protein [Duncaniella sp.]